MRVTSADVPRRPLGLRGWLIGAAVVLVILLLSLRGLARFYTDYLWFKEVGFGDTWRRLLSAKAIPSLIFSTIFFVVLLVEPHHRRPARAALPLRGRARRRDHRALPHVHRAVLGAPARARRRCSSR